MRTTENQHECDLFLLSSHKSYVGDRILPAFARRGQTNIHGWGLGWYDHGRARSVRRSEPAVEGADLCKEFAASVETISGATILGHLRMASCGKLRPENNHPFTLQFLGYDWLLAHNGTAQRSTQLVPPAQQLLRDSDSDTPRVFEFLKGQIEGYLHSRPKRSLIEAGRMAFARLIEHDAGTFNLILSNGHLSFVFIHWRPFFLLNRRKQTGDVALVATLKLTEDEEWVELSRLPNKYAKLLVFNGPTLILNGDIPA